MRLDSGSRSGSSAWWRGPDAFSRSSSRMEGDDDEEALRWAALERLPTNDRVRRAILPPLGGGGEAGAHQVVDVLGLGPRERRALLERLVRVADEDNERFLLKLKERVERCVLLLGALAWPHGDWPATNPSDHSRSVLLLSCRVGIDMPTIEVRFEHLRAEAEVRVGTSGLPTVLNSMTNKLEEVTSALGVRRSRKQAMPILHDVSGIVRPRRMTLLLGPPGSGKTTLLLALAGRLDKDLKVSGKVTYNGHGMDEFVPERTAAYISQHDLHIGEMTVRETLEFSARCQGVGSRFVPAMLADMLTELSRREKACAMRGQEANVISDYILKILGLEICADTMVGDEMLRGISGGQRKRVTTGEMLVGPANALFMDEISTGLDSSTTFQIIKSLRQAIHILGGTALISLLQPAPETYELFDDIILLSDGQIVYQGPREGVLEFFLSLGFKCPERKGVADFLQEVTSRKDQKQYWVRHDKPYQYVSVKEFASTFQSFHAGRAISSGLAVPFDKSKHHPAALTTSRFFKQYLLLLAVNQMAASLFRFVGGAARNMIVANVFGSFMLLIFMVLGGYILVRAYGKSHPSVSEEELKEKYANLNGNALAEDSLAPISSHQATIGTIGSCSATVENHSCTMERGMVLPFTPLSLTFKNIKYFVDMPQEMKTHGIAEDRLELLKGVSGSFRPGVLTALMGVSGAGKTTLMDVLAGRKTSGYIEGNINISGHPKRQETFARVSGYCEQNDIHSPQVTVYESLLFSAWLRLPRDVDSNTRKMFIEEVMELVELKPLRNALVGLPGVNGLSTEQRKRLTIAVELVANPSIIFMDEPTSGLDARAAAIVMRTVRNTVDTGRTVVCTIHQPSIDIFEAFDEGIQGVRKIKDGYNPATWMLEITTAFQEQTLGVDFSDLYKKSELYQRNMALIQELSEPAAGSSDLHFRNQYSQSFLVQCLACLWKQNLSYWRNPAYNAVRLFFTTVIALIFGTVFWDLGGKMGQSQDLFNAMGSMYAAVMFLGVLNATSVQPVVSVERTVFYRERAAGMYSALPYAFGQVTIELPYTLAQASVYGIIVYSMIGFQWTVAKFFWYLFFMYFTFLYFTFYGMMAVGLTPSYHVASIVSSAFYGIWNLFSGFIIPRPKVPIWWRWYCWACPVAWTLYGLVVSQFGDITTPMDNGVPVNVFIENYFGFKHSWLGVVAAVVVAFAVFFACLFGFAIMKLNFQRR
ncbi:hypothetical protein HU200_036501 [Digitaria exilis]|uniref:ABC transporter domain-containing protein n=1 Tax=Digitaria exilis TaxID=1010633 RepID=A0A835BLS9_9POAL|nr:hypothetical protein HU200_036501 [Digitaria exilis]